MYIFNLPLSEWALRVAGILCRFMNNKTKMAWPSIPTIARNCPGRNSLKSVRRGLNELVSLGVLIVEHRKNEHGGDDSCHYRFAPDREIEKIISLFGVDHSVGGGVKLTPPEGQIDRGGSVKLTPPYIELKEVELKEGELKTQFKNRRPKSKAGASRPLSPKTIHPDTPEALQHIRRFYQKTTGQEMRRGQEDEKDVSDLLGVYDLPRVKALWEVWFRAGPWDQWARRMGYALSAWAKAAPELADHEDFSEIRKKYQEVFA